MELGFHCSHLPPLWKDKEKPLVLNSGTLRESRFLHFCKVKSKQKIINQAKGKRSKEPYMTPFHLCVLTVLKNKWNCVVCLELSILAFSIVYLGTSFGEFTMVQFQITTKRNLSYLKDSMDSANVEVKWKRTGHCWFEWLAQEWEAMKVLPCPFYW